MYAEAFDLGIFSFTLRADDGGPVPVPEPPALVLMLAGLSALGVVQRKRHAEAAAR